MKLLDGFVLRTFCGEHIVTSESAARVDYSKIISLNGTAAWLWEQVEGKDFDLDDLVLLLTEHYDVDAQTARSDAQKLLDKWIEAGLVG